MILQRFMRLMLVMALTLGALSNAFAYENLRAREWQEDLRFLAHKIQDIHPDPFWKTQESTFNLAVKDLDSRIPSLKDHEIVTGLLKIAALVSDGHTGLQINSAGPEWQQQFPVVIYPFEDGVYLASASKEYEAFVGRRVIRIGSLPTDSALRIITTIVNGENDYTLLDRVTRFLTYPAAMHALGITRQRETLNLTVKDEDGRETTFEVVAKPNDEVRFVGMELISSGAVSARGAHQTPLHLKDPQKAYWFEHMEDQDALYVQFNSVRNVGDERLGAFFNRVLAYADSSEVGLFILDIRFNHGGNNQLLEPLIHGLIKRDESINQPGRFYTIIGRATFSAAISCLARLEEHTDVRFVGEPVGSGTRHFGDSDELTLPNSKIRAWVSAWTWRYGLPWDKRDFYAPKIAAVPTFASYRAGKDEALVAIFKDRNSPSLADLLMHAAGEGGADAIENAHRKFKADNPDRWFTTESEVNNAGYRLMGADDMESAIEVFRLNAESYPESANCLDSWAEACLASGDHKKALELYQKAIEVDPEFEHAAEMISQMTRQMNNGGHRPAEH